MQHICYHLIYHIGFNPHLTSWLGAALNAFLLAGYRHLFQSSPNLSAGCSLITAGRVFALFWFQSSPSLLAGRSMSILLSVRGIFGFQSSLSFQSSPNLSAGCNVPILPIVTG